MLQIEAVFGLVGLAVCQEHLIIVGMRFLKLTRVYCSIFILFFTATWAAEEKPTTIRVRALARDAKLIGTGVGGALITIYDLDRGEIMARGTQLGGTGETALIMGAHGREDSVFDTPGAAFYETTLLLSRPTPVRITAEAPLGFPESMKSASKDLLLVPGADILGEGVILELHGYIIELLEPGSESELAAGSDLPVRIRLNML